ncbi:hypothetical protein GCM10022291_29500 [Postechiella marina]|uniref:DUF4136 domain-containing protein n=1 Tax=Postechiella marina TaxID=943941 RepID=A0ABP8CF96_9FLAO
MKNILIAVLILAIVACAPVRVNYDYDKKVDFTKYKTYQYYGDMKTGLSPLDTKRFLDALDAKLAAKGLTVSDTPDFLIDIKSSQFQAAPRQTVGVGVGGGGRNVGGGISIGLPIGQPNLNREITIDFVDDKGIGLFWQAVSESGFKQNEAPEKREARLNAIAEKVLVAYPPKE